MFLPPLDAMLFMLDNWVLIRMASSMLSAFCICFVEDFSIVDRMFLISEDFNLLLACCYKVIFYGAGVIKMVYVCFHVKFTRYIIHKSEAYTFLCIFFIQYIVLREPALKTFWYGNWPFVFLCKSERLKISYTIFFMLTL